LRRYAKNFSYSVRGNTTTPIILPENAEERKPAGRTTSDGSSCRKC
jgi:hypothetical protein